MPAKDYNSYMNNYMRKRYENRMLEAKINLGGKCEICGTTENLEIDHIDWCLKGFPLNKLWSVSKDRFYDELNKCQILCHTHHKQKSKSDILEQRDVRGWKNQYGEGSLLPS